MPISKPALRSPVKVFFAVHIPVTTCFTQSNEPFLHRRQRLVHGSHVCIPTVYAFCQIRLSNPTIAIETRALAFVYVKKKEAT